MSSEELYVDSSENDLCDWEFSESMDSASSESCDDDINLRALGSHNPGLQNSKFQQKDLQFFKYKPSYSVTERD